MFSTSVNEWNDWLQWEAGLVCALIGQGDTLAQLAHIIIDNYNGEIKQKQVSFATYQIFGTAAFLRGVFPTTGVGLNINYKNFHKVRSLKLDTSIMR